MDKHGSSAIAPSDTEFISITMVRALAIAGIIIENYHNTLGWHDAGTLADSLTTATATVAGTFVHMFFILSGYGLTLSCLRGGTPSWDAWARERFRRIVTPYWVAVVVTFAVANLSYLWAAPGWQASYSGVTLLAYLSLLRNFYEPGWTLNASLWFMPVLIGLYALFPLMLSLLRRTGMAGLIVSSLLVANVSIAVCVHAGYTVDHQGALPIFFVDKFALGMVLACISRHQPGHFRSLMGFRFFLLGIAFYAVSAVIVQHELLGYGSSAYNDLFSAIGLYLVLLYLCRRMSEAFPPAVLNILDRVSRNSYMMYLIHWPIVAWVLSPVVGKWYRTGMGALPMLLSSFIFVALMFILASGIFRLINKVTPVPLRTLPLRQQ